AAQIRFSLCGETVFQRGPAGIGIIWGFAGIGLVLGAILAHRLGPRLSFDGYKRTVSISYLVHGGSYVLFSLSPTFAIALIFIAISRASVSVTSVLTTAHLLRHVSDTYRGRVFATIETWTWLTMMLSMGVAGLVSDHASPRTIGVWSGILSSTTAIFWAYANLTGRLPEPAREGIDPD